MLKNKQLTFKNMKKMYQPNNLFFSVLLICVLSICCCLLVTNIATAIEKDVNNTDNNQVETSIDDQELAQKTESNGQVKFWWNTSLGDVNSTTEFPKSYEDGTEITVMDNVLLIGGQGGDIVTANAYTDANFDGWYINEIALDESQPYKITGDITIEANFTKEKVSITFRVASGQESMGSLYYNSQQVTSKTVEVGYQSGYDASGNTIIWEFGRESIYASPKGDNFMFDGWYDSSGNKITGSGIVRGSTTIYAKFIQTVFLRGITYAEHAPSVGWTAIVSFYDNNGVFIATTTSSSQGIFSLRVPINISGTLVALDNTKTPRYFPVTKEINVKTTDITNIMMDFGLPDDNDCLIFGYVTDDVTKEPIANADVRLAQNSSNEDSEEPDPPMYVTTSPSGMFYFTAKRNVEYTLGVVAAGYLWNFQLVTDTNKPFCQHDVTLEKGDASVYFDASDGVKFELKVHNDDPKIDITIIADYTMNIGTKNSTLTADGDTVRFTSTPFDFEVKAFRDDKKRFADWKCNSVIVQDQSQIPLIGDCVMTTYFYDQCKIYGRTVTQDENAVAVPGISIYYILDNGQLISHAVSGSDGRFEINVDQNSSGKLWFIDKGENEYDNNLSFYPLYKSLTSEITKFDEYDIGDIYMINTPADTKLFSTYVYDKNEYETSGTYVPIKNASVAFTYNDNETLLTYTNEEGIAITEYPSEVTSFKYSVFSDGYSTYSDSIEEATNYFIYREVPLVKIDNSKKANFKFPNHVQKYNIKYYLDNQLYFNIDYSDNFTLTLQDQTFYYSTDGTTVTIYSEEADKPKYEIEVIPQEHYSLEKWDVQETDPTNDPITGNLTFTPNITTSYTNITMTGLDNHETFDWKYLINEVEFDKGQIKTYTDIIYYNTKISIDENGMITSTVDVEIGADEPIRSKVLVNPIAQEDYAFDHLTVNGTTYGPEDEFTITDMSKNYEVEVTYKYAPTPDPLNLYFNFQGHVQKYNVKYYYNGEKILESNYFDSFSITLPEASFKYEIDEDNLSKILVFSDEESDASYKYEVELIPEDRYRVEGWEVQGSDSENEDITVDLTFTPNIIMSYSNVVLTGSEFHNTFNWIYLEDDEEVASGSSQIYRDIIYPNTKISIDEHGSITSTIKVDNNDRPSFESKVVLEPIAQEGYIFNYITVNGSEPYGPGSEFYVDNVDNDYDVEVAYKENPNPPEPINPEPSNPTYVNGNPQTGDLNWFAILALFICLAISLKFSRKKINF